jgi:hypothetical protein
VGIPFEFEWAELSDRLPNLVGLYRKYEAEKAAEAAAKEQVKDE